MADFDANDPFRWDVGRVVQELCVKKSWPGPQKLPDPGSLEAAIRYQEMDGETLLTYSEEFGVSALWTALRIDKAPHQLSINAALKWFRKQSPGYRHWEQERAAQDQSDSDQRDAVNTDASSGNLASKDPVQTPPPAAQPTQNSTVPATSSSQNGEASLITPPTQIARTEILGALKRSVENISKVGSRPGSPARSTSPIKKKKRVAPTTILEAPISSDAFLVPINPSEGDFLLEPHLPLVPYQEGDPTKDDGGSVEAVLEAEVSSSAYIGAAKLAHNKILEIPEADKDIIDDDGDLLWTRTKPLPPGRCRQIANAMKRMHRTGPPLAHEPGPDSDEFVLPVFRESDDEDVYDEETLREIEEEDRERAALAEQGLNPIDKAAKERGARFAMIADIVSTVLQEMEDEWVSTKKVDKDRKARRMWEAARRDPTRQAQIDKAIWRRKGLEARMIKIFDKILETPQSYAEVKEDAWDWFEPTYTEYLKESWFIDLLRSQNRPPHPNTIPKPAARPKKEAKGPREDGVSVSSDSEKGSESDMDDFIVDDDPVLAPMAVDPPSDCDLEGNNCQPQPKKGVPHLSKSPDHDKVSGDASRSPSPKRSPRKLSLQPSTPSRDKKWPTMEPIVIPDSPQTPIKVHDLPDLHEISKIKDIGMSHWVNTQDIDRLVIAIIASWHKKQRTTLFDAVDEYNANEIWDQAIKPLFDKIGVTTGVNVHTDSLSFLFGRLFDCYISKNNGRLSNNNFRLPTIRRFQRDAAKFEQLYELLRQIMPHFKSAQAIKNKPALEKMQASDLGGDTDREDSGSEDATSEPPVEGLSRRTPKKTAQPENKAAARLRSTNFEQQRQFEERRRQLRELLAESGAIPSDKARLIVNETKQEDQALVYINDEIGSKIKDHQIEGVRFMWNHVVAASEDTRQGCLLAHEMGLGKTMQVITLLVVIAEAASSDDPAVKTQIPEALRESKTLVLCPTGLVDNWIDEFLLWAPEDLLGPMFKVDSSLKPLHRLQIIENWATGGGVMVMGYDLFTGFAKQGDETADTLQTAPHLVVADEAHHLKNPKSQRSQAVQHFRTMSRIALTGSPLTKHVMDYYSMINWVAPNFLADIAEFKAKFEKPISEGLYADSSPGAIRISRRRLHVLKQLVSPKVHRRDVGVLEATLPGKKEFIITLPLTDVQMNAYTEYLQVARSLLDDGANMVSAWSLVALLSLLLAHPMVLHNTIQKRRLPGKKADPDDELPTLPSDSLSGVLAILKALNDLDHLRHSNKMRILFSILDECKKVGDKVLVFSQYLPTLDYIEEKLRRQKRNYKRLDGGCPVNERQASIKEFNDDPKAEVYLISTRAGGVGLNIYGANRVVIFDFKYTPAEEQQAIGRAYRIGQQKQVFVYWLTVGGTFEAALHNGAIFKTQLASRVVDKKNPDPYAQKRGGGEYFVAPTIPELDQESLEVVRGKDKVLDAILNRQGFVGTIRKVITTETFEKEEVYVLSAEDEKEASEDLMMERLRQQNPAEYRRLELERASNLGLGVPPITPAVVASMPSFHPPSTAFSTAALPQALQQMPAQNGVSSAPDYSKWPTNDSIPADLPQSQLDPHTQRALLQRGSQALPYGLQPQQSTQPDASMPQPVRAGSVPPDDPPPAPVTREMAVSNDSYEVTRRSKGRGQARDQVGGRGRGQGRGPATSTTTPATSAATPATPMATPAAPMATPMFGGLFNAGSSVPAGPPSNNDNSENLDLARVFAASAPAFGSLFHSASSPPVGTAANHGNSENLQPMMSPGTLFKAGNDDSPSRAVLGSREEQLMTKLTEVYHLMHAANDMPKLSPAAVMANIMAVLDKEGSFGLPRMDKIGHINAIARDSLPFTHALLSGDLDPVEFVGKDRAQIAELSKRFEQPAASGGSGHHPDRKHDDSNADRSKRRSGASVAEDSGDLVELAERIRKAKMKKRGEKRGKVKKEKLESKRPASTTLRPDDTPQSYVWDGNTCIIDD